MKKVAGLVKLSRALSVNPDLKQPGLEPIREDEDANILDPTQKSTE